MLIAVAKTQSIGSDTSIGNTPTAIKLLRWMRSKLLAKTALTPNKRVAFAAQSRAEPHP